MANAADRRLARELAVEAGRVLVELRAELTADGADAATIGARGDAAAHELLVGLLASRRPDDFVLSEESTAAHHEDRSRLSSGRVWIIDPLDGTREYREGRSDWAVHVALVEDHTPTAGAVSLPAYGVVDATDAAPTVPPAAATPSIVVSRSRPPAEAATVAEALGAMVVQMGSAGAKAMTVVHGDVDVYLSPGALNEWDACAPVAVAVAAGLHVSRLDGSPVPFNQPDTLIPDLLVCRAELAAPVIEAVARHRLASAGGHGGDR